MDPPALDSKAHAPRGWIVDAAIVASVAATFAGAVIVGTEWGAPLVVAAPIDRSPAALPTYTLFSFARGIAAYLISLAFTIAYGKIATASRRAEHVLLPVLDILQSIPVLSFLPGLVLGLVGLFPHSNIGLELACVLAIFTGQVWNMTFSFHASLRAVPRELVEVARVHGFGTLARLFRLELPAALNGLVWNSMMSMAGGWFFLTIVESFTLDGRTYRLPGLGSYMAAAVDAQDHRAMIYGILAMGLMIVATDQLLWRPIIAWADRFRLEDCAAGEPPRSWAYRMLRRSTIPGRVAAALERATRFARRAAPASPAAAGSSSARASTARGALPLSRIATSLAIAVAVTLAGVGAIGLARLLARTTIALWLDVATSLGATAVRVLVVLIAATAWTLPVGILIGRSPRAARVLQPIVLFAASFPAPMLYPMVAPALLAHGFTPNLIAIALMLLGTQWYVLFNVAAGASAVPHDLVEAATIFRLPTLRRLGIVHLACVFPYIVTGLLTAAGGAWNASIVSETVKHPAGVIRTHGIGSLIAAAFDSGDHAALAAATLALAIALVLLNRVVWKPLQRLAATRFAMNR